MSIDDTLVCVGAGCVVGGIWWWCPPAGLIALGLLLVAAGVLSHVTGGDS